MPLAFLDYAVIAAFFAVMIGVGACYSRKSKSSDQYEVCGAHARLEPNGLLWNPSRNCLVGATTPIAKCMEILSERIGLTPDECRAIGHDNALSLIGGR